MFGSIGITELVVICVVALIVIGPQRLPDLARSIGRALGEFRRAASSLQDSLSLDDEFDTHDEPPREEPAEGEEEEKTASEEPPEGAAAAGETQAAGEPRPEEPDPAGDTRTT